MTCQNCLTKLVQTKLHMTYIDNGLQQKHTMFLNNEKKNNVTSFNLSEFFANTKIISDLVIHDAFKFYIREVNDTLLRC